MLQTRNWLVQVMKRFLIVFSAAVMGVGLSPMTGMAAQMGDLLGTGTVTVADALLSLKIAVNLNQPTRYESSVGDVNGDGSITVADALLILREVVGLGPTVSGTASQGSALPVGTLVTLTDANGNTTMTTVGTNGSYTSQITGLRAPYLLNASGFYSLAFGAGTTNINPLTNLSMQVALGTSTIGSSTTFPANFQAQFAAVASNLKTALMGLYPPTVPSTQTDFLSGNIKIDAGIDAVFKSLTISPPSTTGTFSASVGPQQILSGSIVGSIVTLTPNTAAISASSTAIFPNEPTTPTLMSIVVTPANSTLAVGVSQQFSATGSYSDGSTQDLTTSVTWTSSDTSAATVTTGGNATMLAKGSSTITAIWGGTSGATTLAASTANNGTVTSSYTIGGTVSGLAGGTQLSLLDNNTNATVITANGPFTFSTPVDSGGSYSVTVSAQPAGQLCSVGSASGSVATTTISNVTVSCAPGTAQAVQIWGGAREAIALKSDGTVWTWGYNAEGQIGNGSTTNQALPYQVPSLGSITAIMGAEHFNLALKSDGTVWGWGGNNLRGLNQMYLLGLGAAYDSTIAVTTPTQIPGLTNVTLLGSRGYHAVAAKQDGTVWTWGWNSNLSLGIDNSNVTDTPNQVAGVSNPKMLTAGYNFSLALLQDGTLISWGSEKTEALGNASQYGDGALTDSATPVPVTGLTNVIGVSAGWEHVLALKADGTVWAWGTNSWSGACGGGDGHTSIAAYGRLGIVDGNGNPVIDESVPTRVPGLTNVIQVSAGDGFSAALKSDGTVWTFGANGCGQLGNGDNAYAPQYVPVQVKDLSNVVWVTARDHHAQAIKSDGTVWSWGSGEQGELGVSCTPIPWTQYPATGNCVNSNLPIQTQM